LTALVAAMAFCNQGIGIQAEADKVTFEDHALAVFRARCASCHNPDKKSSDLDVTTYTGIMAGGASGPVIEPGSASDSYLYNLITHKDEPVMPPGGTKIPDGDIATIEKWIAGGALETKTSKARAPKKKVSLASSAGAATRPEVVATFPRMKLEPLFQGVRAGTVTAMATHPWAPVIAVAAPQQILVYDTNSLELTGILPFPEGMAQIIRFSRSGQILLAGGGKDAALGKVVLWDVAAGSRIAEIGDELDTVITADISSDHSLVALGGPQKVVRVYKVADGSLLYEIRKHTDWITSLEFSPDSVLLATGDRNGGLFVWHAPTGNEYLTLNGHTAAIHSTTWRMDSNLLVSASEDTTVRAWEMENGGTVKSINAHGGGVTMAQYDRDGNLTTVGRDQTVKMWNPAGDAIRTFTGLGDIGTAAAITLESGRVFGGDWQGNLIVWNAADGVEAGRLNLNLPTLADRLAVSTKSRDELSQTHSASSAELGGLQQQLATVRAQYEKAAGESAEFGTAAIAKDAELANLAVELTGLQNLQKELETESASIAALIPELTSLAVQANKVAELSPGDQQLAAVAQQIGERLATSKNRAAEIEAAVVSSTVRMGEINTGSAELQTSIADFKAKLESATAATVLLQAEMTVAEKAVVDVETVVQQLSLQLAEAGSKVQKWSGEIAFVSEFDRLQQLIAAADSGIGAAVEAQEGELAKLAEAQAAADQAAALVSAAEAKKNEIQQQLDALRGIAQ